MFDELRKEVDLLAIVKDTDNFIVPAITFLERVIQFFEEGNEYETFVILVYAISSKHIIFNPRELPQYELLTKHFHRHEWHKQIPQIIQKYNL